MAVEFAPATEGRLWGRLSTHLADLSAGKTVRVNVPPYSGQSATLVSLLPGMTTLANGKRVQAAKIRLSNNRVVAVPLANLDVLE